MSEKTINDYPPMIQAQIKKAGSIEAWRANLKERQSRGGRNSYYERTEAHRKAASERARARAASRGEKI